MAEFGTQALAGQIQQQPSVDQNVANASKLGVQLATQQDQIDQQKQQVEAQRVQIQSAKLNGAMNTLGTWLKMSPELQKNTKDYVQKQMEQYGIPTAGGLLDTIHGDDNLKAKTAVIVQALTSNPNVAKQLGFASNPDQVLTQVQALGADPLNAPGKLEDLYQQVIGATQASAKQANELAKTQALVGGRQQVAETQAQGRVQAAQVSQGTRQDRLTQQANKAYSSELGKTEQALYSAQRADDIIGHVTAEDLKSTPTLAADLNSAVASLLAGGKPATVHGVKSQEMDSLWARLQKAEGFLTGNAVNTITPEQIDQLQKDIHAVRQNYVNQHATQFDSFLQGQPASVQDKATQRYNTFRQRMGLDQYQGNALSAQPAQGAPKAASGGFDKQGFINAMTAAGKSPEEIQAFLKAKGVQ